MAKNRVRKSMGRFLSMMLALSMMVVSLMGCGKKTKEDFLADCEYITPQMYENATDFTEGDNSRIADCMRRAEAGEDICIGVIGGSITQGSSASSQDKCYASLVKKWWEEKFPEAKINFVNAGIGGTSSYYGVHRLEKDLMRYNPDFVIVEFSVNDSNDAFYKRTYDNLVYRILNWENEPAVMLLFMTMDSGISAQANHAMSGFSYELPMISYKNAVLKEIEAGNFTWKDISPDNIHPNDRGHAIIGEFFEVYLEDVYAGLDEFPKEKTPFKKSILTKPSYQEATILYPGDIEMESTQDSYVFSISATRFGVLYQKYVNGSGGQYEVFVDGKSVKTLNADFTGGWGNYAECEEVYVGDAGIHQVEIRRRADSTGDAFEIKGILVNE